MKKKKVVKKTKIQKDKKPKQLSLGLKSPFSNVFFDFRSRVSNRLNLFEANKFINDALVWFFVTLQTTSSIFLLVYVLKYIEVLPSILPILQYSQIPSSLLLNKFYLLLAPLFSFFLFLYSFKSARENYFKNPTLARYILFLSTIFTILISLHILKIITSYV